MKGQMWKTPFLELEIEILGDELKVLRNSKTNKPLNYVIDWGTK